MEKTNINMNLEEIENILSKKMEVVLPAAWLRDLVNLVIPPKNDLKQEISL